MSYGNLCLCGLCYCCFCIEDCEYVCYVYFCYVYLNIVGFSFCLGQCLFVLGVRLSRYSKFLFLFMVLKRVILWIVLMVLLMMVMSLSWVSLLFKFGVCLVICQIVWVFQLGIVFLLEIVCFCKLLDGYEGIVNDICVIMFRFDVGIV